MQKRKSVPKCSKTKKLSHILIFFFSKTLRIETLPGFFLRSDAKQKFMQLHGWKAKEWIFARNSATGPYTLPLAPGKYTPHLPWIGSFEILTEFLKVVTCGAEMIVEKSCGHHHPLDQAYIYGQAKPFWLNQIHRTQSFSLVLFSDSTIWSLRSFRYKSKLALSYFLIKIIL